MKKSLVIIGASGRIGTALLERLRPFLAASDCPIGTVRLYARTAKPERIRYMFRWLHIDTADNCVFSSSDSVVFCCPTEVSERLLPKAMAAGCETLIDLGNAEIPGASLMPEGQSTDQLRSYTGVFGMMQDLEVSDVVDQVLDVLTVRVPLRMPTDWELRSRDTHEGPPTG